MFVLNEASAFVKNVWHDPKIPARDKKILILIGILILSPIDIVPDWFPIVGLIDDVVYFAIILDYFFRRLDQNILLAHYPWSLRSFTRVRLTANLISWLAPRSICDWIWKYRRDPF